MCKSTGMTRPKRQAIALAAMALAIAMSELPAGGQEAWWNYAWQYRRELTIADVPQTNLEGDEVGVVTMPTGGLVKEDSSDITVVASGGAVVPHRLLMTGPGDQVRLAFALKSPVTKYWVYFGNDKPPKPAAELVIKRGVLEETWEFKTGAVRTLDQVKLTFDKAGPLLGRDFRTQIFQGINPFGPQDKICSLYTAWLVCPKDGEYQFSTSSQDASFLLVDGKEVVDNGGTHQPQRRAARAGTADLKKGLHELKVYHVCGGGDPVITAAWQEPDGKRIWAIPTEAFAPIRTAKNGMIERYGKTTHADFLPVQAGESFIGSRYYQRFIFDTLLAQKGSAKPTYKWDFGDGQTTAAGRAEHVFLHDGPFKVTLTVQVGGETLSRTNTIMVARPWEKLASPELDSTTAHAKMIADYDFSAAPAADVGAAIDIFHRAAMPDAVLKAGDALLKQKNVPPAVLRDAVPLYADALVKTAKDPARAVAALARAAEMTTAPIVASTLTVQAGRAALDAGDVDKALSLFDDTLKKFSATATPFILQQAHGGRGDVFRARGDAEKATAEYKQAATAGDPAKDTVRKGDLARHAEEYIRTKAFEDAADALDKWAEEFPADKLEGYWSLLKVKLLLAQKLAAPAAAEAETLVKVSPRSNYAPELLMLAATAYESLGQSGQARASLQAVVDKYAESPLAAAAKARLAGATSSPASAPATRPASGPAKK